MSLLGFRDEVRAIWELQHQNGTQWLLRVLFHDAYGRLYLFLGRQGHWCSYQSESSIWTAHVIPGQSDIFCRWPNIRIGMTQLGAVSYFGEHSPIGLNGPQASNV